ncbi:MAG: hypothetical protein AB1540_06520 [Bdellovibrionota bacterium]
MNIKEEKKEQTSVQGPSTHPDKRNTENKPAKNPSTLEKEERALGAGD